MKRIIYLILLSSISFRLAATSYYVSLTGNDVNNGTSVNTPFLTISKALNQVSPGDFIYVRGGIYTYSSTLNITKSGTVTDSCHFFSYPGERPILDFSGVPEGSSGVVLTGSYWHVKGFEIIKAGSNGMYVSTGGNNVIEWCSFHENKNVGLRLGKGTHDNRIINCDGYYNADPPDYGDADGFACAMDVGMNNYFYGCRAWLNVDDGFDGYLRGADDVSTIYENCWAWQNGYFKDGTDAGPKANGNGFKTGGSDVPRQLRHNVVLKNCVAFDNKSRGFDQNSNRGNIILYNCTAYRNVGSNFSISQVLADGKTAEVKNCVAVDGKVTLGTFVIQDRNSWMSPFAVSAVDFISLDTTGMGGARKSDGKLPDVNFVHLASGSDLIDGGVNLGIPFSGTAPDLGAFEFNQGSSTSIRALKDHPIVSVLRVGPNPASEYIKLFIETSVPGYVSCNLYDLQGNEVWTSDAEIFLSGNSEIHAPLSHLPDATYILRIRNSGYSQAVKIMKL